MTDLETVALAIWRQSRPRELDLAWEDMFPTERRVALNMARAAVVETATILRAHRNPAAILALTADKIVEGMAA